MLPVHIGCGAGFAGDRSDVAGPVVDELVGRPGERFLIFETLAERTLALALQGAREQGGEGYSPSLERLVRPVLRKCLDSGIRIVGNFGAADPGAGAKKLKEIAASFGRPDAKVAAVEGDDLTGVLTARQLAEREVGDTLLSDSPAIVSANAYLGARPVAEALDLGADIVITGRVSDPALVLGPLVHCARWRENDWDLLAAGTLAGHLLECGAQVTGGYFADPGYKDVPGLEDVGYPIAEFHEDGSIIVSKPAGTGGRVDRQTVLEQLLYEIHDPAAYLTPDVTLDIRAVRIAELGDDRVSVVGAKGRPRPETLKATVCFEGGVLGEAEISYAGPNARARARLAADVVSRRMRDRAPGLPVRIDMIGVQSVFSGISFDPSPPGPAGDCGDIRLRFATEAPDAATAGLLLDEVEALYCAGPAGGGGVRRRLARRYKSASCLIERGLVAPRAYFVD
ncbi:acyclic terpene utilization AtuA family protein [Microbaculum marinum]|uniref:Acyclic terpene utilization AtuA family protein n=1 Tax=Microbaculum marinum TaxID=1764581 RepID=A0AAW9RRQ1_9HYPH